MGAIELKDYIIRQLDNADERVLRIVASVFDNYSSDTLSNITSKNYSIAEEEYLTMVNEGFEDIKSGNVFSHEKMKEEIEKIKSK